MRFYIVTISYHDDQEFVPVAESASLTAMKQLAELICRHARPEISWVKIEDDQGRLLFYWSAATYGALLGQLPANEYVH